MPLDPVIAAGYQGVQLPNPLEGYARVMQIQQAQQQNALNALTMRRMGEEDAARNALSQRLQSGQPFTVAEAARFGKPGYDLLTAQRLAAESEAKQKKADADLAAAYVTQARNKLPMVSDPQTYASWRAETLQRLPGFEPLIPVNYSPQTVQRLAMDADKMLKQHFVTQNLGGEQQVLSVPEYGGGPATVVPGSRAAEVPLPADVEAQKGRIAARGAAQTTVKLPEQEKEFEKALGSGQAKKLLDDKIVADDARSIIDTVQQGRRLLQSGMITGFGAETLTQLGAALNQAGIKFAEEPVANTQAFSASMAANVGRIIKQFGAGTGLSNADREYAEKMAGGKVTLDRKAIERILDINERAARNVIAAHNKRAAGVKTNVPLMVEAPPAEAPAAAPQTGRPSLDQIFKPRNK